MSKLKTAKPARAAAPSTALRGESHVFVRDLMMTAKIGLHQHERLAEQRVRINLDLTVADNPAIDDDYDNVVCYGGLVTGVRRVIGAGHVNLAETLAERIAAMCLEDRRVLSARVRVEKLDVFPEAASVGVEIERFQRRS
ncbi:MAG TPA: dihydroneopterin aldolase [Candidatus Polarisedimenticolia bacterium]|jgi:dihydroneopterin aldolase|nr:dihydroneopterin aldolase [Dongiaceae bacterium]HYV89885.1 dihydroneopterin aldolase [Candidatus Polarisedimenticolia bacterium]